MWLYLRLFVLALRLVRRNQRELVLENLVLRQQLLVWERSGRRPRLTAGDRRFWSTIARAWPEWSAHVQIVQPATVARWHRSAWRRYWTWRSRSRGGRPPLDPAVQALIHRMIRQNPTWGAVRIVGELRALGIVVSATTVRRYRRGLPRRPPSPSWRTFLQLHAPDIWAADLFTVQTLTFRTLFVLFVIGHDRRRIVHWNVTAHPTASWIWQQMREATAWGHRPRFLIRDRDACYGRDFIAKAAVLGIRAVLTPVRAPQANAITERWVGSVRRECLDHLLVVNERHLRRVLGEYVGYYNTARPHRALDLDAPLGRPPAPSTSHRIVARPILGGLHHVYEPAA